MTGDGDPTPAEKLGVLEQLSYHVAQKVHQGSSVDTRSPNMMPGALGDEHLHGPIAVEEAKNFTYRIAADSSWL